MDLNARDIGNRINLARKSMGLTQEGLGELLSLTPQAVSKWETGEAMPDIGLIPDLCSILGISSDTLLGIEGEGDLNRAIGIMRSHSEPLQGDEGIRLLEEVFWTMVSQGARIQLPDYLGNAQIAVRYRDGKLDDLCLFDRRGLAVFVNGRSLIDTPPPMDLERWAASIGADLSDIDIDGDTLKAHQEAPSMEEGLHGLRDLLASERWKVVDGILSGIRGRNELMGMGVDRGTLDAMADKGFVTEDGGSFSLVPATGLLLSALLKAILMGGYGKQFVGTMVSNGYSE